MNRFIPCLARLALLAHFAAAAVGKHAAAGFAPALGNREDMEGDARVPGLEISGLVHLADLDAYLAISDDTPGKRPELYLLDSAFARLEALTVAGLDKMDDMEAITSGIDGSLYLLSSQSRAKSGKLPGPRKLLVKARRDGKNFTLAGKITLLDALETAARADSGSAWARFLLGGLADQSVDIEGMALEGDGVLLGFKAPLLEGKAVILRVAGVDALLSGRALRPGDIALWRTLDLKPKGSGRPAGISDLLFGGEDLYILSPGPDAEKLAGNSGRLWKLARGASAPVLLQEFRGGKPEGLVRARGRMHVAFDNGASQPSTIREIDPVP